MAMCRVVPVAAIIVPVFVGWALHTGTIIEGALLPILSILPLLYALLTVPRLYSPPHLSLCTAAGHTVLEEIGQVRRSSPKREANCEINQKARVREGDALRQERG